MKTYKITATGVDCNGVEVDANMPETLGEAYGASYASRAEAESFAFDLQNDLPEGSAFWKTLKYCVIEVEVKPEVVPDYGPQNDWTVWRNGFPCSRHNTEDNARVFARLRANDEPDAVYTVHPINEVF
jgi:hypothetical protein